jgi:spore maturation protein A
MNYLWGIMLLIGVVYAALTGNLAEVTDQALLSAKEAVTLCITMAGVMAFWVGIMEIAEKAGFMDAAARLLSPVLSFLFPRIPKDHPARKQIAANMVANMLGLGWAATPAGLSAMKELQQLEEERNAEGLPHRSGAATSGTGGRGIATSSTGGKRGTGGRGIPAAPRDAASNEMCIFLIINISSLQLIPVNIIAYRSQYGSVNPAYIVGPAMAATAVSTLVGVIFCKLADRITCKPKARGSCKPTERGFCNPADRRKERGK